MELLEQPQKFETFKEHPVRFGGAPKDKALRCKDTFSEQHKKSVFVEGIPLNVRGSMGMYWAVRPAMNLLQLT